MQLSHLLVRVFTRESVIVDSGSLGKFFRYANRKLCSKSTIGPLYNNDSVLTTDPNEISGENYPITPNPISPNSLSS
jgi:hypothetical protein